MRIAVTIEKLDVRRGGAEVGAVRLIQGLSALGHEIHLFTEAVAVELPPAVQVSLIPLPWPGVAARQWTFVRETARRLHAGRFDASVACGRGIAEDIVWAQNGAHPATVEGAARSYYHQPLLRWFRQRQDWFSAKSWSYREIERRCFLRPNPPWLIAVSNMVAREYQSFYGLPEKRVRVAYYQISLDRFSPEMRDQHRFPVRKRLGLAADELAVLFVGQNFKRKGVRLLVEAAAELKRTGAPFQILVAGGSDRQARPFEKLARQLGCGDRMRFLGQQNKVEQLYAAADVFCLPTFYDSFGMVALEAMACGVPAVVSRFGGVSELVQNERNGFVLAQEHSATELASALRRLADPGLRERLGESGIATAQAVCRQNSENDIARVVEGLARELSPAAPRPALATTKD